MVFIEQIKLEHVSLCSLWQFVACESFRAFEVVYLLSMVSRHEAWHYTGRPANLKASSHRLIAQMITFCTSSWLYDKAHTIWHI